MQDNTTKQSSNLIYSDGRQTGSIKGDTYYRTLKDNHYLRFPELSIAISEDVLDQLQALEVQSLEFKNADSGTKYTCSLEHFLECGRRLNRGFGEQVALPLTGFVTTGQNLQPVYKEERQEEKRKKQLAFQGWM